MEEIKCIECGTIFKATPSRAVNAKFCSHKCRAIYRSKMYSSKISKKCAYCGKEISVWPCELKDNNYCSKKCVDLSKIGKPSWNKGKKKQVVLGIKELKVVS